MEETGFRKQGMHSAGVARPYSGTAGGVAHGQMGVFVAYAGARGYTLVDRALYLPQAWTRNPARLQGGLTLDTTFAIQPQLARRMLARVLDAGLPAAWVTGDSVYGHAGDLRPLREDRGQAYVLAVPRNEPGGAGSRCR